MNDTYDLRGAESHIEVHKFRAGAIIGTLLLVLFLQKFLPLYVSKAEILDLPLLITVYFGLSRRNPSTGLLLVWRSGSPQDSLSGMTVAARTLWHREDAHRISGFFHRRAAGIRSIRPHALPSQRFSSVTHQGLISLTRRILLAQTEPWFNMHLLAGALVNALVAVFLFLLLDRLRKR